MVRNAGKFSAEVTRWVAETNKRADEVLQEVCVAGLRILKRRSPIKRGAFRRNWRAGVGSPDLTADRTDVVKVPPGSEPSDEEMSEFTEIIQRASFGDTVHLTENLPYAGKLERGSSTQAPRGVLRLSFLELKERLPEIIRRVTDR